MILHTFCKIASHFTNYKKIIDCKTHRYRGIVKGEYLVIIMG